jgi:hypothetical protein
VLPLAQRTRYPGEAGTRGGWGGTPSGNRILDSSNAGMRLFEDVSCMSRLLNDDDLHLEHKKARVLPASHHKSIFCAGG